MKRKKSILRKAKEAIRYSDEYNRKQIINLRKKRLPLYKLAREIQPVLNGNSVYVNTSEISIDCKEIEESRKMVTWILENTSIETFIITMEKSYDKLVWHYKGIFKDIKVFVGPSPPSKECWPALKANVNSYWICEKRG